MLFSLFIKAHEACINWYVRGNDLCGNYDGWLFSYDLFFGEIIRQSLLKLVNILLDVSSEDEKISYKISIATPYELGVSIVKNAAVLFFEVVVEEDPALFSMYHEGVIQKQTEG